MQTAIQPRSLPPRSIYKYNHFFKDASNKDDKSKIVSDSKVIRKAEQSTYILLADDDYDDRELFKEAILDSGHDVRLELAHDGKQLLTKLSGDVVLPDMIFLDLNMPFVTGKECLDQIRKTAHLKNIPVIIYSTSSSLKDIEETFNKGANMYITKPSSYKDLLDITNKVLSINWEQQKPNTLRTNFVFQDNKR